MTNKDIQSTFNEEGEMSEKLALIRAEMTRRHENKESYSAQVQDTRNLTFSPYKVEKDMRRFARKAEENQPILIAFTY